MKDPSFGISMFVWVCMPVVFLDISVREEIGAIEKGTVSILNARTVLLIFVFAIMFPLGKRLAES